MLARGAGRGRLVRLSLSAALCHIGELAAAYSLALLERLPASPCGFSRAIIRVAEDLPVLHAGDGSSLNRTLTRTIDIISAGARRASLSRAWFHL